ncbi:hypothetical protein Lal_00024351 [Lupinus albus]|uniref:Putative transcription factor MYB-related family n=1 Tax=Lupinus albus TaxID=3870 RepID=A0A6A5M6L0_LUPAL|nr:putative transcription factor MYB-related family [Lupinus albus]KAF1866342.1 hypothetical protein Lal_00024351 [Lupinus albus]
MENQQNQNPTLEEEQNQVWGTWEELLLACAVNRHGFKDWDTVAMEVQSRTTLFATARHCEQKFHDLNRRFADQCNDDDMTLRRNGADAGDGADHVPWVDELRKQRVDELRREVQHYDVSILSLQLKVKRLEEEREKENCRKEDEKPDLDVSVKKLPENEKTGEERDEPEPVSSEPEPVSSEPDIRRLDESTTNTDKVLPTTADESDRENQSVNESNSTGSRFEGGKSKDGDVMMLENGLDSEPGPVHDGLTEPVQTERKEKPVGEESNNGSCDTVAKVLTCESVPPSEERGKVAEDDDSSELRDSVAHSGGTRESSEVQSSASLTRKRNMRRRKEVYGGDGSGEVTAVVRSESLVGLLELIRRHEHSSLFERRLDSQESDEYKNTVRRHMDLKTIQLRLQNGNYSSRTSEFFSDLLLIFSNAIVFFPKDSRESQVAQQLRHLVSAELKNQCPSQSDPITQKTDSQSPNAPQAKPDSLLSQQKAAAPIVVCRKRSSISAKPSSATIGQKDEQPIINDKEKPISATKPPLKTSSDTDEEEEEEPPKAKEKPVTGARSLRRSNKNLNSNNSGNKKLATNTTSKAAGSSANKPAETPKLEKSKAEASTEKRNAAADFLKRIKQNAPAEGLKSGGGSSSSSRGGAGGKEQKKIVNKGKVDKGKERNPRQNNNGGGSGDKRNKNIESKRSVGRPPKKATETNAGSAKRGRDNTANASASKDKRPNKRSKK